MASQPQCNILSDTDLSQETITLTPEQYNDLLHIQHAILKMIAEQHPYMQTLDMLCILAEKLLPNSVASIMLKDQESGLMSVISAPSVPQEGIDALTNLTPGPTGGSCGNAIFHNQPQYVSNTFEDTRWEDLRDLAKAFNLCSCWSMPVRDANANPIGTFALSSFEHRAPSVFHKKILQTAASIVTIILGNKDKDLRIKLFSTAMQNASEGIMITDENNKIIEVNKAFEEIYGYKEVDVVGKNPSLLSSKKHSSTFYQTMWHTLHTQNHFASEIINKKADGTEITQWLSISYLKNDQNPAHYLAIFTDLTELKASQDKIKKMAYEDPLTQLANKTALQEILQTSSQRTLLLLNINNFSYINTAYGFEIGDKLLQALAETFVELFEQDSAFRINADEFAFLYQEETDITQCVAKIRQYFYEKTFQIDGISLNISFTFGAAHGDEKLLRNAALALKQAKENGKNSLYIFNQDEENIDHKARKMFIDANNILHNAFVQDRIVPFFQGIYDNTTGEINKYETLARIIDEDGTVVSPYKFIEPARLAGLLPDITKVMIEKSFAVMADEQCSFSINITEDDLSQNYLLEYLLEKANRYNIAPSRVILEILEGISANGKKNHINQLNLLKQHGFSLAIDDFGSEYSNFERVLDLEIDFLKIDAKYIKDIDTNKKSYEIVKAISFFAKNVGIPCIAEFVHNAAVQKILLKLNIEYSQGYFFSEPSEKLL